MNIPKEYSNISNYSDIEIALLHALFTSRLGLEGLICTDFIKSENKIALDSLLQKGFIEVIPHPFIASMGNVVRLKIEYHPLKINKYPLEFSEAMTDFRNKIATLTNKFKEKSFEKFLNKIKK